MVRRETDLVLAVLCSIALVAVDVAASPATPARVALGVPFVLVLPGYVLTAALFPHRTDLDFLERTALSVGLSAAIIPLLGLALNYSPWGIRPHPIVLSVMLFTLLVAAVAAVRRRLLPREQAFRPALAIPWRRLLPASAVTRALAAVAALLVVIPAVAGAYLLILPKGGETYTEFYALGPGGRTEAYPSVLSLGESARLILGVANHEGRDSGYQIVAKIDGAIARSVLALRLEDGERWEREVAVAPSRAGDGQKVEYLLYREGVSKAYRRLHLWLNVKDHSPPSPPALASVSPPAVAGATTAPAPPAQQPAAPAQASPPVHMVSPGEYLSLIASGYGVTLEALLAINDIDNPDLIYPKQRINLPPGAEGEGQ